MRQAVGLQPIFLNRHPGLPPGAGMIQAFGLGHRTLSTIFTETGDVGKNRRGSAGLLSNVPPALLAGYGCCRS